LGTFVNLFYRYHSGSQVARSNAFISDDMSDSIDCPSFAIHWLEVPEVSDIMDAPPNPYWLPLEVPADKTDLNCAKSESLSPMIAALIQESFSNALEASGKLEDRTNDPAMDMSPPPSDICM